MERLLKLTYIAVICVSTISCKEAAYQSVTEPMTLEEIKETTEQFNDFGYVYDQIFYVMSDMSPAEKAEFASLTYADYYRYQKEVAEKDAKWDDDATKEWQKLHGWKVAHIDSVYYYWKRRREEYLESHKLTIEPVAYSVIEGPYQSKYPAVSIKITSKRGEIGYFHAVFAIENKNIDNFDNILSYYYSIGLGGYNDIYVKEPVKEIILDPRTFRVMGDGFKSEDFSKMSFDELKAKYKFGYKVCRYELTEEAIAAEKKLLPFPKWAEKKLGYNEGLKFFDNDNSIAFYKNAIENELNETFEGLGNYKQAYKVGKMQSLNLQAYNLYQLINEY